MKLRYGFVSNSSSSSFILGKDSSTLDITAEELVNRLNQGDSPADFLIISATYEGVDAFELTNEMGYLVKNYSDRFIKYGKKSINHIYYCVAFHPDTRSWNDRNYGTDTGLDENESCIWVNYESIGSDHCFDSEEEFFKRFFLSEDEWNFVDDSYNDSLYYAKYKNRICVYSEKIKLSECDDSSIKTYDTIGFNEDITQIDNTAMFVYKKLTDTDKEMLLTNKQCSKQEVFLYKNFEVLGKDNSFKALADNTYTVASLSGIIEKVKKLDVFIAEKDIH